MNDLGSLLDGDMLMLFFKVIILFCIGLLIVFTIFLLNYVNSLKRIIVIKGLTGTTFIYFVAIGYIIAAISLFFLALVIL